MATILNGTEVGNIIREHLRAQGRFPKLAIIEVGNDPRSEVYIRAKKKFGESVGAVVEHIKCASDIGEKALIDTILQQNERHDIHGIILQLPLPRHMDPEVFVACIDYRKDVDGLCPINTRKLWAAHKGGHVPGTARGIRELLGHYGIEIEGKKAVVVGKSTLVGKPIAHMLMNEGATVTVCHKKTKNLAQETGTADILVSATGAAGLIGKEYISKGAVVIDVGISVVGEGVQRSIVGDVRFNDVQEKVSAITPVPGGVGPMTVACLFKNLFDAEDMLRNE